MVKLEAFGPPRLLFRNSLLPPERKDVYPSQQPWQKKKTAAISDNSVDIFLCRHLGAEPGKPHQVLFIGMLIAAGFLQNLGKDISPMERIPVSGAV